MRRTDGHTSTLPLARRRRPAWLSALAAVGLHAVLLVAVGRATLPAWQALEPIRISLLPALGPGSEPAGVATQVEAGPSPRANSPAAVASLRKRVAPATKSHSVQPKIVANVPRHVAAEQAAASPPVAADGDGATLAGSDGATADAGGLGAGGGGLGQGAGGIGGGGDQRPFCESCPEPDYPLIARRRGWNGKVDVELVLLADGKVDSAEVARSSGYDALDNEAILAARRSRFRLPSSHRTPLRGRIEYRFELVSAR